jgi:hypothetical protein
MEERRKETRVSKNAGHPAAERAPKSNKRQKSNKARQAAAAFAPAKPLLF